MTSQTRASNDSDSDDEVPDMSLLNQFAIVMDYVDTDLDKVFKHNIAFGEKHMKQNADTSQWLKLALDKRFLASTLDAENDFEDALLLYQQALEIYRAEKTQDDDDIANKDITKDIHKPLVLAQ